MFVCYNYADKFLRLYIQTRVTPVKMADILVTTPKTGLTAKICDSTISNINSHD